MDLIAILPGFLLAVLVISASPGPAMLLIFQRAATRGFRAAVPTVLGLEVGIYLWALAAGAGLAALVAASETAYLVLRVVGAVFLVYLGVRALRAAWRLRRHPADLEPEPSALGRRAWGSFGEALLVQLANPKAAVFMFAFYPQFVPAGSAVLLDTAVLAAIQVGVELVLYLGLAAAVGSARAWFARRRVRMTVEATGGAILLGLGARVALTER